MKDFSGVFNLLVIQCQIQTIQNRGGKTINLAASNFGVLSVNITNLKRHIAHIYHFGPQWGGGESKVD